MSTYTEFGKLKKVIVGNIQNYNLEKLDLTFKIAYGENMRLSNFDSYKDYKVDKEKILERKEDLDNLARIISNFGVEVYRPDELNDFITFKTLHSKGVQNAVSSPRDRVLIYGDMIIETPPVWTKRYFENQLMYNLFFSFLDNLGYTWISAPNPGLSQERLDKEYWNYVRDFQNFDRKAYDIAFDAANILKIGKDLIFNISTYNHELGADWLQRVLGPNITVHKVYQIDDNHIDGKLNVLRPGCFLSYDSSQEDELRSKLPKKFQNWDILFTDGIKPRKYMQNDDISFLELCSERGAWTNVLSIDEETVLCLDTAIETQDLLQRNGFTVVPVQLRHSELFGGGIHCSTLDVERDDACIDYTI